MGKRPFRAGQDKPLRSVAAFVKSYLLGRNSGVSTSMSMAFRTPGKSVRS